MIDHLCKTFEKLNEIVYLADAQTYELHYLNEHARQMYGVSSIEAISGRKCYEVLRGRSEPCLQCRCQELTIGEFHEWSYNDRARGLRFLKKDVLLEYENRNYLFSLSFDSTEQRMHQEALASMLLTEEAINDALSESLREHDAMQSIKTFIRLLGEKTHSERIYIFEKGDGEVVNNTYEWCAEGITPQIDNLQQVPMEVVSLWYDSFNQNRNVVIPDVEDIKHLDPLAYDYLVPQDIHSLVVSPLLLEGKILGFYGVDNPPRETMTNISNMAWIVGHFLVSLLQKYELVKHLEKLSYYEQLTGLQNRHAMNARLSSGRCLQRLGIIYCDVMGLKRINDSLGHQAGDNLLSRAADCLRRHFRLSDLYRIGGDEFLVLCADIDKADFERRAEALRSDMAASDALMALGCVWMPLCRDADGAIAQADKLMYDEKQAYYAAKTE